jgi:hypothetical protein
VISGVKNKLDFFFLSPTDDLSIDEGFVHNHFDKDKRGCWRIINEPDEDICLELFVLNSLSESRKRKYI